MFVSHKRHQQSLMQHFDFDAADLAANHAGQFSSRQVQKIAPLRRTGVLGLWWGLWLGLAPLAFLMIYVLLFAPQSDEPMTNLAVVLSFYVLWPLLAIVLRWQGGRRPHIHQAEGKPQHHPIPILYGKHIIGQAYAVEIGGRRFDLKTRAQFDSLHPATAYRVYYWRTAGERHLLSIVVLHPGTAAAQPSPHRVGFRVE